MIFRFNCKEILGVGGETCRDIHGQLIPENGHFIPGPEMCKLCVCKGGQPENCKGVLCAPPTNCKSFKVGESCCDFTCLDSTIGASSDIGI